MPDSKANTPQFTRPDSPEIRGVVVPLAAGAAAQESSAMRHCAGSKFLLDEAFRIPFTRIRFGVDGIVGLSGSGRVAAGLLSLIIPIAAWVRGVPYVTLARMTANICISVLVGTIPIVGDAFDIAWKTNAATTTCCNAISASRGATHGRIGYFFSCWPA